MKKYKFKFSNKFHIFSAVAAALAVLCLVLNTIRLVKALTSEIQPSFYTMTSIILCLLLPLLICLFLGSAYISSYYSFDEKTFSFHFGIIKESHKMSEITELIHVLNTGRLIILIGNDNFNVIIDQKDYTNFIGDMIKTNKKLTYNETVMDDPKKPEKKS